MPFRIGLEAVSQLALYGSKRPVNDIDISLSGTHFSVIVPLVQPYIVAGPKRYRNKKWDCTTLSLNYKDQDIDLTDVDTLLMRDKEGMIWKKNKAIYGKFPDQAVRIGDLLVTCMHPKVLLEYKEHLDGVHQQQDREFLKKYIEENE